MNEVLYKKENIAKLFILCFSVINRHKQFIDPVVGFCYFEMAAYLVYTILWTINRNHHKSIQILIHKILYFTLIYELIFSALNSACYTLMLKYPQSLLLSYAATIISFLMNAGILLFSILLASGLSVVFDSLTICQITLIIFSTTIFSLSLFSLECLTKYQYNIGIFIFFLILFISGYLFYFLLLMYFSKIAIEALIINLEMIYNQGINPNTTPTFKKLKMLKFTRNSSITLFFFIVICYVLYFADVISFWIIYLVKMIFMLCLVGIICYKCRIRQAMSGIYGDDEDAYVVNDEQSINDVRELHNQMKKDLFNSDTKGFYNNNNNNQNADTNCNNNQSNAASSETEEYELNNLGDNNTNENQNEPDNQNKIEPNQNETENQNETKGNENNVEPKEENQNKGRDWKPDDVLPSIPQIRKLSTKVHPNDI